MKKWKVYYDDGTTYEGPMETVPIWNVLVIVEEDSGHGRRLVMGGDYYIFMDGMGWVSCDHMTIWQYLNKPGLHKPLVGVMAPEDVWNDTVKRARNDPDFVPQTATYSYERKEGFD